MLNPGNQLKHPLIAPRRSVLQIGGLSAFGLLGGSLGDFRLTNGAPPVTANGTATASRCILIWLDGGPSHLETFDPKPDAAAEVRGPLETIETSIPGIHISECLPGIAKRAQHFSFIRSMTSPLGEHNLGTHYLLTGYQPSPVLDYPAFLSVIAEHHSSSAESTAGLPEFVAIPDLNVGGAQFRSEGYLNARVKPFPVQGDPASPDFQVRHLQSASLGIDRVRRRRQFIDEVARLSDSRSGQSLAQSRPELEQAFQLATSDAVRKAFDLQAEPAAARARYGSKTIGQACLLARRLIEHGVPLVTVNDRGWDTHTNLYTQLKEGFTGAREPVGRVPSLDLALSALIDDLDSSGLLSTTLILVMGEFGRTPKINATGGRDHWPRVFSVAVAGGGTRGGQVIGSSDKSAELPLERALTPADLTRSVFSLMGLNPDAELQTNDGRPVRLAPSESSVIHELWS